jgi:hypothetical protein
MFIQDTMKYLLVVFLSLVSVANVYAQQKKISIEPTIGINNNTCYIEYLSSHSPYFSLTHPLTIRRVISINTGIYIHYRINEKFKIKAGYTNANTGTTYSLRSPDGTVAVAGYVGLSTLKFPIMVFYDAFDLQSARIKIQPGFGCSVDLHPDGPYGDFGVNSASSLNYTVSVAKDPYINRKMAASLRGALVLQFYSKSNKERVNLSIDYNLGLSPYGGAFYTHTINNQSWTTRVVTKGTYVGLNLGYVIGIMK